MISRGLLFSGAMARANATGAKSETRRAASNANARAILKAFRNGEDIILWQRESFRLEENVNGLDNKTLLGMNFTKLPVWYEADCGAPSERTKSVYDIPFGVHRPGIHMPKWASRVAMTVKDVREERIGDITDEGAIAEGIDTLTMRGQTRYGVLGRYGTPSESAGGWDWEDWRDSPTEAYFRLYDKVNAIPPGSTVAFDLPVIVIRYAVSERTIRDLEKQYARSA